MDIEYRSDLLWPPHWLSVSKESEHNHKLPRAVNQHSVLSSCFGTPVQVESLEDRDNSLYFVCVPQNMSKAILEMQYRSKPNNLLPFKESLSGCWAHIKQAHLQQGAQQLAAMDAGKEYGVWDHQLNTSWVWFLYPHHLLMISLPSLNLGCCSVMELQSLSMLLWMAFGYIPVAMGITSSSFVLQWKTSHSQDGDCHPQPLHQRHQPPIF